MELHQTKSEWSKDCKTETRVTETPSDKHRVIGVIPREWILRECSPGVVYSSKNPCQSLVPNVPLVSQKMWILKMQQGFELKTNFPSKFLKML